MSKIGIYKVYKKTDPKKFFIIGARNIDQYWNENGSDETDYSLLWPCTEFDLEHYTKHFQERYKSTFNAPEKKVKTIETLPEPETEKAVIPEPSVFKPLQEAINVEKVSKPIRKTGRRKK